MKVAHPISALCRTMGVSRSGFYDYLAKPTSARSRRNSELTAKTRAVFAEHRKRYGSPRIHRELRERGEVVSKNKIAQIMRENDLIAHRRRRFRATTDSKHKDPIAPNLLSRNFTAHGPNQVWVTDVTAVWTLTGRLFLAAIIDLFSRRVVGWATSATNDRWLALAALRGALIARRPASGLIHHSDRGSPYASDDYRQSLDQAGAIASMSRKGDCWDNAVAESLFATIKNEAFGD